MNLEKIENLVELVKSLRAVKFIRDSKTAKLENNYIITHSVDDANKLVEELNAFFSQKREQMEKELKTQLALCARIK